MVLKGLQMAYDEIKKGKNTELFRKVVGKIDGRLGTDYGLDNAWYDAVDRRAELKKNHLENELNGHRTNSFIESIRIAYNDLGDFYYARGQLAEALENYSQDALERLTTAKLRCAAGLAYLEQKKYKLAAREFVQVGPELGNNYAEVIAPQDVAAYSSLCALASFDRSELKSKVIDNANFRNFLELVPDMRELINVFHTSHASCLKYLKILKANLLLDIHLHDHVETLYEQINKSRSALDRL